jgi:hypothetical protein
VQDLRGRPQDLRLPMHYPVNPRAYQIADVLPQRRRIGRQCTKDEIAELVDPELFQPVLIEVEPVGHPAAPDDTAAKGDALQVVFEVVTPGMIDTSQVVGMAAPLQADEVAAMGAAVQHGVDFAVMPARDDEGVSPRKVVR